MTTALPYKHHRAPRCFPIPSLWLLILGLPLAIAATAPMTQAQDLLRVDQSATGANDGSSWEDAYIHLQDAIDEVNTDASTEYEIRIAEGVYYPDDDEIDQISGTFEPETGDHVADDPSEAFTIARDSVILKGGYPTGGGDPDPNSHPTVLSGDITQDDTTNDDGVTETVANQNGDNSFHVVSVGESILEIPDSGGSLTGATRLHGLTITAGKAEGSSTGDEQEAGHHRIQLNGTGLSTGTYFGRLQAGSQPRTQKITLIR